VSGVTKPLDGGAEIPIPVSFSEISLFLALSFSFSFSFFLSPSEDVEVDRVGLKPVTFGDSLFSGVRYPSILVT